MSITRTELESAISVVREGRRAHGLYAFEDAQAVVKSAARLYWRQIVAIGVGFILGRLIASAFLDPDVWTDLATSAAGVIGAQVAIQVPALRALFAPPELHASDVAAAYACEMLAS